MNTQIKKDIHRGEGNTLADGATLLGEGNAASDHAHVKKVTPLDTKRDEIMSDPKYQGDAVNTERERNTTAKRQDKEVRPL